MNIDANTIIGIDTGGTFTDFVYIRDGKINVLKELSTPDDPGRAVISGLNRILGEAPFEFSVIHGSTVATNALLERKGSRTALITTKGFKDLLEIGRQNRPSIYDLETDRPTPLVPASFRYEIDERTLHTGEISKKIDISELKKLLITLEKRRIGSIAICFLHSYANPKHEKEAAAIATKCGFSVSPSSEILPEYREYERMSTTVVNAYVAPIMDKYLNSLQNKLAGKNLRIMKSNGGIISADTARKESVHTILSGPAGGVVGAFAAGKLAGYRNCITFDMGGTSTDVSLCAGKIVTTSESAVAGCPIRVPIIDIHTVGAGGGSIASMDIGGALQVGPESAGAVPGPACYGFGNRLTVTDANLALKRLDPGHFLGGEMKVFPEKTDAVLRTFSKKFGMDSIELAAGIINVVNSNMEKALRVISIAKGYNPADFALVSFGGAGGIHAADLARTLNIGTLIIPANPGIYSAMGMLYSDLIKDYSQTILIPAEQKRFKEIGSRYLPLEDIALNEMKNEGVGEDRIILEKTADMRYIGQSFELSIPFDSNFIRSFHKEHLKRYGFSDSSKATEVVNIRLRCTGKTEHPKLKAGRTGKSQPVESAIHGERNVFDGNKFVPAALFLREKLTPGMKFSGPAVVHEYSSTIYVPRDFGAVVDKHLNLVLKRR